MTDLEINEFIEQRHSIGDEWTFEEVKEKYGNMTLEEALKDRMQADYHWANINIDVANYLQNK